MPAWATRHIDALKRGDAVTFRPHGLSMAGLIESGQLVTVVPRANRVPAKGDVVLCKVKGRQYLHLVKAVDHKKGVLIGNNRGDENGWTSLAQVYGFWVP